MSRAHELAWCAGFFDGEGWITIQRRNSKVNGNTYEGHYLRIGINHVAPEPLQFLQSVLGGVFKYDISSEKQQADGCKRKPRYKWHASTSEAAEIIKQLLPYMRNKNKVAELALTFQNTMRTDKRKVSDEVFNYREFLKQEISNLNAKD